MKVFTRGQHAQPQQQGKLLPVQTPRHSHEVTKAPLCCPLSKAMLCSRLGAGLLHCHSLPAMERWALDAGSCLLLVLRCIPSSSGRVTTSDLAIIWRMHRDALSLERNEAATTQCKPEQTPGRRCAAGMLASEVHTDLQAGAQTLWAAARTTDWHTYICPNKHSALFPSVKLTCPSLEQQQRAEVEQAPLYCSLFKTQTGKSTGANGICFWASADPLRATRLLPLQCASSGQSPLCPPVLKGKRPQAKVKLPAAPSPTLLLQTPPSFCSKHTSCF